MVLTRSSFEKHLDTLFRVTHSANFNTSIQALMLIQQLTSVHQGSTDRFYRTLYESLLDPRLLTSSKQTLYLNLLFKALRSDLSVRRVKAFCKRLLQVASMQQPAFTCGTLYLLRELEGTFANLRGYIDEAEENESDEEESFHDVQDREIDSLADAHEPKSLKTTPRLFYDGRKRDPEHSNAERSSLWEILPLLNHYHPSVSLFGTKLATHLPMPPKPDLSSHTLIHFLDRFVYRNPKATAVTRGSSIMQPLAIGTGSGLLLSSSHSNMSKDPVNSEAFWKMGSEKIGADEVFFHKYFNALGNSKEKAKERKKKKIRKGGSEDSEDEDEEEIWKALVESRPELEEKEDEEDLDMDVEDLESAMGDNENDDGNDNGQVHDSGDVDSADRVRDDASSALEDLDFEEDDEAFLGSDDEIPIASDAELEQEASGNDASIKKAEPSQKRDKRRKLKQLPTFASAEDYAEMLGDDEE